MTTVIINEHTLEGIRLLEEVERYPQAARIVPGEDTERHCTIDEFMAELRKNVRKRLGDGIKP
jgi:hypothetical protein